jgi:hypothetical protein
VASGSLQSDDVETSTAAFAISGYTRTQASHLVCFAASRKQSMRVGQFWPFATIQDVRYQVSNWGADSTGQRNTF